MLYAHMCSIFPVHMTIKEDCRKVSEIMGIDAPIIGTGSTLKKEWLKLLYKSVILEEVPEKITKHEVFDRIVGALGSETAEDYKEDGLKSDEGTITALGTSHIRFLVEKWSSLSGVLGHKPNLEKTASELTSIIIDSYLPEWLQATENERTGDPTEDFNKLDNELMAFAALNDEGVLTPSHVEFCLAKLMADQQPDREDDTDISVGDAGEDAPSESTLSHEIISQLEQPGIDTLVARIKRGVLDLNPPWQRKRVWSETKQRKLMRSVILGLPLPSFILFKPKNSSKIEVVDGKQRLSSFDDYIHGRIKFPRIPIADDVPLGSFTLRECSDKFFDDLPAEAQEKILGTVVHTSTLKDVDPQTIYEVFTIYNSSGTRLNAVEIRNAAFQQHAIHKKMVELSGEQTEEGNWSHWTSELRTVIGNGNLHQNRYKYLAFVERYLGYSRAYNELGRAGFKRLTTTKSIKAFYDHEDADDVTNAKEIAKEVKGVFQFCLDEVADPFGVGGKFHALKSTNSLILCRLMRPLIENGDIKKDKAIEHLDLCVQTRVPDNQNTSTIWNMHIQSVANLWEKLTAKQKKALDAIHSDYLDLLLPARNS